MVFIVILVVIFITLVILVQAGVMPWFIRTEGQRLRTQVDVLATQLREQLDRVEAQQRSMAESVVTLKSFALDKSAPGETDSAEETGSSRQFLNALVKETGERLGGRAWIVDDTGRIMAMPPVRRRYSPSTILTCRWRCRCVRWWPSRMAGCDIPIFAAPAASIRWW